MRLAGRRERLFDPDVKLLPAEPEPDAAALTEQNGSTSSSPSRSPKNRRASSSHPTGAASWT